MKNDLRKVPHRTFPHPYIVGCGNAVMRDLPQKTKKYRKMR